MREACKKHFSLSQVYLEHETPATFILSQWQKDSKPSIIYLLYRWAIAIIFLVIFALSIADVSNPDQSPSYRAKWLIYLTDWGYTACTLQALIIAIILTICFIDFYTESKSELLKSSLKLYKAYWVVNVIATDIAFTITTLYWPILYDGTNLEAMNFLVHAANTILMMMDLFVVSHPVRLLHCCYPALFGLCYVIFSAIYYAAGGLSREGNLYIYPILDWSKPGPTVGVCIGVLAMVTVIHVIAWGLHHFRLSIHSKCFLKKRKDENGSSFNGEMTLGPV